MSRIYNLTNSSSEQQCDCVVYKFLVSLRRVSRAAGSKIASRARAKGGGTLSAGGTSSEPTPACSRRERRMGENLVLSLSCSRTLSVFIVVCSPADSLVSVLVVVCSPADSLVIDQ